MRVQVPPGVLSGHDGEDTMTNNLPFDLNLVEIDRIGILSTESMTREVREWFGEEHIDLIPNISSALVRHISGALELVLAERIGDKPR